MQKWEYQILSGLVGSEMCIRDRSQRAWHTCTWCPEWKVYDRVQVGDALTGLTAFLVDAGSGTIADATRSPPEWYMM